MICERCRRQTGISEYETQRLLERAAEVRRLPLATLLRKGRSNQKLTRHRRVIMRILWEAGANHSQISRAVNRDRSTVIDALEQIDRDLKSSAADFWRRQIEEVAA